MSFTFLNPPLPQQPAFRVGSTDGRFYDLTPDLSPLGITVASITSVTVARVDGAPIGAGDLTISTTTPPYLDTTKLIVNWWQIDGLPTLYQITVTVTTSDGRTLIYDCLQLVTLQLG